MSRICILSITALASIPLIAQAQDPSQTPPRQIELATVPLRTGVTVQYAEKGQGRGKVIVFLHGYTDSWLSFSEVLAVLPPSYHGYALTQRGHGNSEKPVTGYAMRDFAADAIAFLDAMKIRKATFVGHSMGSVITQRIAIHYPDRVNKLVLVGAGADIDNNPVIRDLLDTVKTLDDPIDPAFVLDFQASTVFQSIPQPFLDAVVQESLKVPARVWKSALTGLAAEDTTPELARIRAPTLIVWGDKDEIFPLADQQQLNAGIPNTLFLTYADTGHGLHWEAPRQFTTDLTAFVR